MNNVNNNLDGINVDPAIVGEVSRMIVDDCFQNGYEQESSQENETPPAVPVKRKKQTSSDVPLKIDRRITRSYSDSLPSIDSSPPSTENIPSTSKENQPSTSASIFVGAGQNFDFQAVSNDMLECQCCFCESNFSDMVPCCEGHLFCNQCLNDYVKQKCQDGVRSGVLECMENDCDAPFARSMLSVKVPDEMLKKLDERIEAANIAQAALPDLVRCPKCQIQFELPEEIMVLVCGSCQYQSCRNCKIEWTAEHQGKKCEELETDDTTKQRRLLEEQMSEAIMRRCPKCKTPLIKNQGCNKLTCNCGGKLCYVCKIPIKGLLFKGLPSFFDLFVKSMLFLRL